MLFWGLFSFYKLTTLRLFLVNCMLFVAHLNLYYIKIYYSDLHLQYNNLMVTEIETFVIRSASFDLNTSVFVYKKWFQIYNGRHLGDINVLFNLIYTIKCLLSS